MLCCGLGGLGLNGTYHSNLSKSAGKNKAGSSEATYEALQITKVVVGLIAGIECAHKLTDHTVASLALDARNKMVSQSMGELLDINIWSPRSHEILFSSSSSKSIPPSLAATLRIRVPVHTR
jgi:hypothetical protein